MKVGSRQVDGVTIVDCSGRITLGEGSVILRDTVRDILSKGNKKIVLNLADVNYIDSSGIGELVSAFTTTKNQGGELKLLNLTKKVNDLLQITKLYTVFDVKDDGAAAVKSFKYSRSVPAGGRWGGCPISRVFGEKWGTLPSFIPEPAQYFSFCSQTSI